MTADRIIRFIYRTDSPFFLLTNECNSEFIDIVEQLKRLIPIRARYEGKPVFRIRDLLTNVELWNSKQKTDTLCAYFFENLSNPPFKNLIAPKNEKIVIFFIEIIDSSFIDYVKHFKFYDNTKIKTFDNDEHQQIGEMCQFCKTPNRIICSTKNPKKRVTDEVIDLIMLCKNCGK